MKKKKNKKLMEKLFSMSACFLLVTTPTAVQAASAVSVIEDARDTADYLREKAILQEEHRKAVVELKELNEWLVKNEKELTAMKKEKTLLETALKVAEQAAKEAAAQVKKLENSLFAARADMQQQQQKAQQAIDEEEFLIARIGELEAALSTAQQKAERVDTTNPALQAAREEAEHQTELATDAALAAVGYDENRLEEVEAQVQAAVASYYKRVESLENSNDYSSNTDAESERIELELNQVQARLDTVSDTKELAVDANLQVKELESDLFAAKKDAEVTQKDVQDTQSDYKNVTTDIELLEQDRKDIEKDIQVTEKSLQSEGKQRNFQTSLKYYRWHDSKGNHGYQLYQPYDFTVAADKTLDLSLHTGYVKSNNQSYANGKVSTFTDTTLSAVKANAHDVYTVEYLLDINLPTGKARTNPNANRMSDDLVEMNRFGEGWNYTPGICVSRKNGEADTWSFTTRYAMQGNYESDSTLSGVEVSPGHEWSKSLSWMHIQKDWQFLGELSHSNYGKTNDNGLSYRESAQLDWRGIYNRKLDEKNDWMFYWYYSHGGGNQYDAVNMVDEQSLHRNYYGTEWCKKLDEKRNVRLMLSGMNSSGRSYDPLTYQYTNAIKKYGIRLGYDWKMTENKQLSVDVERFYMKDKTQNIGSHGYGVFLSFEQMW